MPDELFAKIVSGIVKREELTTKVEALTAEVARLKAAQPAVKLSDDEELRAQFNNAVAAVSVAPRGRRFVGQPLGWPRPVGGAHDGDGGPVGFAPLPDEPL